MLSGSTPGFIADHDSVVRNTGRQIDWSRIPDSYRLSVAKAKANGAAASGATSITVDALPQDVPAGTRLEFGSAVANVTVTTSGVAAAGATAIPVNALSGPIPSGTLLDFTGAGEIALTTADAAAGATSLTVEALDAQIESGDTATYTGGSRLAVTTAPAAKGATSLTVDELPFAVPDNAEAVLPGTGAKTVRASTIMAELSSGKVIPRALVTGSETAVSFQATDAVEGAREEALSGCGQIIGGVVYKELLVDRDHADFNAWIAEINTAGPGVRLETYSDSSAS